MRHKYVGRVFGRGPGGGRLQPGVAAPLTTRPACSLFPNGGWKDLFENKSDPVNLLSAPPGFRDT